MEFVDKEIVCKDCKETFVFEAGQQRHFHSLGFTSDPVRCPECRKKRKNSQSSDNKNRNSYYNNDEQRAA